MDARLHGHLGHAGQVVESHDVAHDIDLGVPRKGAVREDLDPACSVTSAPAASARTVRAVRL